ncbi:hypothetical protein ACRRTK_019189 [Alexandromys fortis]
MIFCWQTAQSDSESRDSNQVLVVPRSLVTQKEKAVLVKSRTNDSQRRKMVEPKAIKGALALDEFLCGTICRGFCEAAEGTDLLRVMIQTVPDPAAYIKINCRLFQDLLGASIRAEEPLLVESPLDESMQPKQILIPIQFSRWKQKKTREPNQYAAE